MFEVQTDTVMSYSGRPGCMCGCRGNYNSSPRARKMALTQILMNENALVDDFGYVDEKGVAGCLFYETRTRHRVLYLTKSGVEKAFQFFQEMEAA